MFLILRAFLPNERSWIFCWILNAVLPTMIPKNILQRVNVIISDGDSQECSWIDCCIKTIQLMLLGLDAIDIL